MNMLEVIPHKFWLNKKTGRKVSIYGACPWTSLSDKDNWEVVTDGWTWLDHDDNTVGCHRVAAKTLEEANEYAETVNAKRAEIRKARDAWNEVKNLPPEYTRDGNIYNFAELEGYTVEKDGRVFWISPKDNPDNAFWLPNLARVKEWVLRMVQHDRYKKHFSGEA